MGPCGVLIITTPSEIFWYKIVSFYSALVIYYNTVEVDVDKLFCKMYWDQRKTDPSHFVFFDNDPSSFHSLLHQIHKKSIRVMASNAHYELWNIKILFLRLVNLRDFRQIEIEFIRCKRYSIPCNCLLCQDSKPNLKSKAANNFCHHCPIRTMLWWGRIPNLSCLSSSPTVIHYYFASDDRSWREAGGQRRWN